MTQPTLSAAETELRRRLLNTPPPPPTFIPTPLDTLLERLRADDEGYGPGQSLNSALSQALYPSNKYLTHLLVFDFKLVTPDESDILSAYAFMGARLQSIVEVERWATRIGAKQVLIAIGALKKQAKSNNALPGTVLYGVVVASKGGFGRAESGAARIAVSDRGGFGTKEELEKVNWKETALEAVLALWNDWQGTQIERLEAHRESAPSCDFCQAELSRKALRCSRCRKAPYCNAICQKKAWPSHKRECKVFSSAENSLEEVALSDRFQKQKIKELDAFALHLSSDLLSCAYTACRALSSKPLMATHQLVVNVQHRCDTTDPSLLFEIIAVRLIPDKEPTNDEPKPSNAQVGSWKDKKEVPRITLVADEFDWSTSLKLELMDSQNIIETRGPMVFSRLAGVLSEDSDWKGLLIERSKLSNVKKVEGAPKDMTEREWSRWKEGNLR